MNMMKQMMGSDGMPDMNKMMNMMQQMQGNRRR